MKGDWAYSGWYELALREAARPHHDRPGKATGIPCITRLLQVSLILRHYGFPTEVVVAGLLHDAVEDVGYTLGQVEA